MRLVRRGPLRRKKRIDGLDLDDGTHLKKRVSRSKGRVERPRAQANVVACQDTSQGDYQRDEQEQGREQHQKREPDRQFHQANTLTRSARKGCMGGRNPQCDASLLGTFTYWSDKAADMVRGNADHSEFRVNVFALPLDEKV
jgi:hypothetical protein